jgi:hypothetical protein
MHPGVFQLYLLILRYDNLFVVGHYLYVSNNYTDLKTISNYPIYMGNKYAEIDEVNIENKIAIFIDGNY